MRSARLGEALAGIVPERLLTIRSLHTDAEALRIRYEVSPGYPKVEGGIEVDLLSMYEWRVSAVDDVGTTYSPGGGATGRRRGVKSLSPPVPADASRVELLIQPAIADRPSFTIRVEAVAIQRVDAVAAHGEMPGEVIIDQEPQNDGGFLGA